MKLSPLLPETPVAPCALQQHPRYGQVLAALGSDVRGVTADYGGTTLGHAQILLRRFGPARLAWMPRGPVWANRPGPAAQTRFMRSLQVPPDPLTGLICMPDTPQEAEVCQTQGFVPLLSPQYVAEIDLTLAADARRAAQHGKWRNRLRAAENSRLKTTSQWFCAARDSRILQYEQQQRRRRRYAALPPVFTLAWADTARQSARLFTARFRGELAAFMLVLLHAPTATYHIGWTGAEGRRHSAHNLLLWQASNWLAQRGYQRFDLGNVDTQSTPGLARFKIGSGAIIRPLGPTLMRLPLFQHFRRFYPTAA